jgi:carboxypeptidase C (cathepsin A)
MMVITALCLDLTGEMLHNTSYIDKFNLNREIRYEMQSDQVYLALYDDYLRGEAHRVEYLLSKNIGVLVYVGQDNLMVHAPGTMRWLDRLSYSNSDAFRGAVMDLWRVNGKLAGTTKSAGKLEFKVVFNAGRYVSMDQPEFAFDMVRGFIDRTREESPVKQE